MSRIHVVQQLREEHSGAEVSPQRRKGSEEVDAELDGYSANAITPTKGCSNPARQHALGSRSCTSVNSEPAGLSTSPTQSSLASTLRATPTELAAEDLGASSERPVLGASANSPSSTTTSGSTARRLRGFDLARQLDEQAGQKTSAIQRIQSAHKLRQAREEVEAKRREKELRMSAGPSARPPEAKALIPKKDGTTTNEGSVLLS